MTIDRPMFPQTHPQRHKLQNLTGLESAIRYDGPDDGSITCGPPRQGATATARSDWIPEWVGNDGIFRELTVNNTVSLRIFQPRRVLPPNALNRDTKVMAQPDCGS
jgi:hypothetical protein